MSKNKKTTKKQNVENVDNSKQVFIAYYVNSDFENEIIFESTNLNKTKKFIEKESITCQYPIILDWYYIKLKR